MQNKFSDIAILNFSSYFLIKLILLIFLLDFRYQLFASFLDSTFIEPIWKTIAISFHLPIAFKSEKEWQLKREQYNKKSQEQIRKEIKSNNYCYRKVRSASNREKSLIYVYSNLENLKFNRASKIIFACLKFVFYCNIFMFKIEEEYMRGIRIQRLAEIPPLYHYWLWTKKRVDYLISNEGRGYEGHLLNYTILCGI